MTASKGEVIAYLLHQNCILTKRNLRMAKAPEKGSMYFQLILVPNEAAFA
jgi:hypothetical protein